MQVTNEMFPSDPAVIKQIMSPGPQGPIFMVNMLKFREHAKYADGRATQLSGREAYAIYARAVSQMLPKFGGRAVFAGDVTFLMLGKADELWDEIAIASYPDRAAMVRMSSSKEWQGIAVHRTAGLAGQLNIETTLNADLDEATRKSLRGEAA